MYRIGIDVGGTFTDLLAVDHFGRTTPAKVPMTPADPTEGVLDGLTLLAEMLALDRQALLTETERIVHGTTVATNALIERKGAKVGLLTTEGHRDVIEMREGLKDDRYNLRMPPPEPLVPCKLRLGVRERLRAEGTIETPLDKASLDGAIAVLGSERIEAVAVCYLHSWRDPRHERHRRGRQAGSARCLHLVVGGHSAADQGIRTGLDDRRQPYVGPGLSGYLARLERRLIEAGYGGPILGDPVARRGCADRGSGSARGRRGPLRACRRGCRQYVCSAPRRGRQSDPVRYGRDQHRHFARA
jgi:N-methylhydantoinase A